METRDFANMIILFCQKVSEMNISRKCKMELLGMITDIEIKHDELMPKWIPVSEKLPDKTGRYLVTMYSSRCKPFSVYAEWTEATDRKGNKFFRWEYEHRVNYPWDVIAWMPLPEPYRGEA